MATGSILKMHPFTRIGILFGLAAITTAPPALHAGGTLDAKAGWALLKQCATQPDDAARHACTDAVLRRAGLLAASGGSAAPAPLPPTRAAANSTATVPAATAPAAAVPAAGGPAPAWYAAAAPVTSKSAAAAHEPDQFQVTLSAVQTTADGKLLLTTTDGAIWKQTESQTLSAVPRQGQAMLIKRKSLGSFMCEPGRYVSFRCYRVR